MADSGLSSTQAQARLRRFGPNETADAEDHSLRHTLAAVAGEPMFLLLIAAAAVYLAIGDLGEGLLLGFFAMVSVGLVVLQQYRGERALQALRALAVPHVRVIRDGKHVRVRSAELVPGDLMLVSEGERVAADGLLREATALHADESLLTGESVPVRKRAGAAPQGGSPVPGGDDTPHLFAGTLVVGGHGLVEVSATGGETQMGRIGASLAGIDTRPTPLQQQIKQLVRQFGAAALALSGLLVLWHGLMREEWLQGLLSSLAFAMAMLPEEIPMVLTVFVGLAAWRMARIQVLARRPAVVEALGAISVLCVDKTGTLTENRQRLRRLVSGGLEAELPGPGPMAASLRELMEWAVLASHRGGVDPLDTALLAFGDAELARTGQLHPDWVLAREYALTPELPAMSQAWRTADGTLQVAVKGAVEAIAGLCRLQGDTRQALLRNAEALAAQGLRVLAVARARDAGQDLRAVQSDYSFEFVGLAAFEDPLRPGVPEAIAEARAAGIAVAMITGDHAATALAIARQAGIDTAAGAVTGSQLAAMDDAALAEAVRRVRVFARVLPQQKLRLVQVLQANGDTVAMTGDGVNDAPALKAAHVGIAMGVRGTDVAREAAGLVLLDEDVTRIVQGVRMGRRTFDNLRRAITYITAIHVPIAGLALLPLLFGLPPILLPAHVVLIELVVDPVCSFAFEGVPEDGGIMRRPPRAAREALLGRATLRQGAVEGLFLLVAVLAIFLVALRSASAEEARTLAVLALTAGNLMLVWVNTGPHRGGRSAAGRALALIATGAALTLALAVAWEPLRGLLQFAVPPAAGIAAALVSAAGAVLVAHASVLQLNKKQRTPP